MCYCQIPVVYAYIYIYIYVCIESCLFLMDLLFYRTKMECKCHSKVTKNEKRGTEIEAEKLILDLL